MRILITGGAGYIGSHATRLFLSRGHQVWIYDNLSRGHRQAVPCDRLITGDLADCNLLNDVLNEHEIEAVVHFAGLTYVGESVTSPDLYYLNNVAGTLSLLEAVRQSQVRRFVFSSTAAVYGNPARVPIVESDPQSPINPYGRTKLMIEEMLSDYAVAYGFGYAALRYFSAAGASPEREIGEDHAPETHLIPIVLQVALGQRSNIDVFGVDYPTPDGTCIRDYVHVNDLAEAHLLALERIQPGRGEAFNLGTGRGTACGKSFKCVARSQAVIFRNGMGLPGRAILPNLWPRRRRQSVVWAGSRVSLPWPRLFRQPGSGMCGTPKVTQIDDSEKLATGIVHASSMIDDNL